MHKSAKAFFFAFILMAAIVSCTNSATPQINTEKQLTPGYPVTDQQPLSTSAYPGPSPEEQDLKSLYPESVAVPEPKADLGVITGKVIERGTNQIYLAPTLILGELTYADNPSAPPLVGFSEKTDPKAIQDQSGKFVFEDIKPGKYSIVVWTPMSQTLVSDGEGKTVLITVEAGKVIDLGDVYVP